MTKFNFHSELVQDESDLVLEFMKFLIPKYIEMFVFLCFYFYSYTYKNVKTTEKVTYLLWLLFTVNSETWILMTTNPVSPAIKFMRQATKYTLTDHKRTNILWMKSRPNKYYQEFWTTKERRMWRQMPQINDEIEINCNKAGKHKQPHSWSILWWLWWWWWWW